MKGLPDLVKLIRGNPDAVVGDSPHAIAGGIDAAADGDAAARADQLLDEGDMAGAETWHRILNAIERLQAKAPAEGEKVHWVRHRHCIWPAVARQSARAKRLVTVCMDFPLARPPVAPDVEKAIRKSLAADKDRGHRGRRSSTVQRVKAAS